MKVMIIGSGGREHALAWKLAQSAQVEAVYVAPGNGGTGTEPKCENLPLAHDPTSKEGIEELIEAAKRLGIAWTLVGPEAPLAAGIVDAFTSAGLEIVGPNAAAARLESSKVWSKTFMTKYGVNTGHARTFSDVNVALHYAKNYWHGDKLPSALEKTPIVIKADGLASGKGVVIASSWGESEAALKAFMQEESLGEAGKTILIEEFIQGREISIMAAVSVSKGQGVIVPFVSARDHKARFEGGRGANTGGMGAIAPTPDFDAELRQDFNAHILHPTLQGFQNEGIDYKGFLFFGLMIHHKRCYLLEYNVRLGDPETQALMPLLNSDLSELCMAILKGSLNHFDLQWKPGSVCAPVLVADGYPGRYRKGDIITIDEAAVQANGAKLFMAGAEQGPDNTLLSSGGRVLSVSSWGANPAQARDKAYAALEAVRFEGMGFRRDIGA